MSNTVKISEVLLNGSRVDIKNDTLKISISSVKEEIIQTLGGSQLKTDRSNVSTVEGDIFIGKDSLSLFRSAINNGDKNVLQCIRDDGEKPIVLYGVVVFFDNGLPLGIDGRAENVKFYSKTTINDIIL